MSSLVSMSKYLLTVFRVSRRRSDAEIRYRKTSQNRKPRRSEVGKVMCTSFDLDRRGRSRRVGASNVDIAMVTTDVAQSKDDMMDNNHTGESRDTTFE